MAKIQVEVGGQLQNVTKSQLFDLAKSGDIAPETRLVVDGKETKARKVQGIEFAEDVAIESSISLPSTDNPFLSPDGSVLTSWAVLPFISVSISRRSALSPHINRCEPRIQISPRYVTASSGGSGTVSAAVMPSPIPIPTLSNCVSSLSPKASSLTS